MITKRRSTLALLGALSAATAAARVVAPPPPSPPPARARNAYLITRHRFGINNDWAVPHTKAVEQMPLTRVFAQDNQDLTLRPDGMVQVNTQGLYRVVLGMDWKAQAGLDIDRRMIGVRRKLAGSDPAPSLQDIRLGSDDTPASDTPRVARWSGACAVNLGAVMSTTSVDVTVTDRAGHAAGMVPGDVVSAAHTGLGAGVIVQGVVIAPDVVRVSFTNLTQYMGVVQGTLNVLAQSATLNRGESNDAWKVLNCPLEELMPGDALYVCARVLVEGDYVQATDRTTFLQVERFG